MGESRHLYIAQHWIFHSMWYFYLILATQPLLQPYEHMNTRHDNDTENFKKIYQLNVTTFVECRTLHTQYTFNMKCWCYLAMGNHYCDFHLTNHNTTTSHNHYILRPLFKILQTRNSFMFMWRLLSVILRITTGIQ